MNKEYYISMISKKLSNELNAAQLKDLNSWMLESRGNTALADEFKQTWDLTASYKQSVGFNASSAFESFSAKYDIGAHPAPSAEVVQPKRGKFRYLLLGLLLISIVSGGLYMKNLVERTVTNRDMAALTIKLNDASSITLAPNSKYLKGESLGLFAAGSEDMYGSSIAGTDSDGVKVTNSDNVTFRPTTENSNGVKVTEPSSSGELDSWGTYSTNGSGMSVSADPTASGVDASGEMILVNFDLILMHSITLIL